MAPLRPVPDLIVPVVTEALPSYRSRHRSSQHPVVVPVVASFVALRLGAAASDAMAAASVGEVAASADLHQTAAAAAAAAAVAAAASVASSASSVASFACPYLLAVGTLHCYSWALLAFRPWAFLLSWLAAALF